jgi:phosphatidylglycerol:prolipoprotein diacylglycerol transferase
LAAAVGLAWLQRRGLLRGQLIKLYIILYLIYRFLTELVRSEPALALRLTGYQWACLGLLPVFVLLWVRDALETQAGRAKRCEEAAG